MPKFTQNYPELFNYIYRYIWVRINDRDVTADLVSDVFVSALENAHKFDDTKGSWQQWFTGIAKNRLLMHWRSQRDQLSLDDFEVIEVQVQSHLAEVREQSNRLDQQTLFNQMLDSVSSTARQLLLWHYSDGFTYEEIAELTDKSPEAVRKFFSRLHKQLQDQFEDHHNDYD